jgi:hypothetical protein
MPEAGQRLGQDPAEVVVIIVEHDYPLRRGTGPVEGMIACQQVIRGQDAGVGGHRNRAGVPPPDAVVAPARAGSDQDVGEPAAEGIIRGELVAPADSHHIAVAPVQLADPVLGDAAPGGQAGQARLTADPPAELAGGLGEHHGIAPLAKGAGRFQAGRPGPDDQDAGLRFARPDPFRMPAPAPLLAHGRVLRAADRRHGHVAGDADVAADALAYVVKVAGLDLGRQERVRNRWPGRADHVQQAGPHLAHHGVRRREAPHPHHRFGRQLLEARDQRLALGLGREARCRRVELPGAEDQIPDIGQVIEQRDDLRCFAPRDSGLADPFVDRQAARDGRPARAFLAGVFQDFGQQPRPVGDRSAVGVGALVVAAGQEVVQDAQVVSAVDVDDVVSGRQGAADRQAVPAPQVS